MGRSDAHALTNGDPGKPASPAESSAFGEARTIRPVRARDPRQCSLCEWTTDWLCHCARWARRTRCCRLRFTSARESQWRSRSVAISPERTRSGFRRASDRIAASVMLASGGLQEGLRRQRDHGMTAGPLLLAEVLAYRVQVEVELRHVDTPYLAALFNNRIFHSGSPINSSGEQKTGHW